MKYFKILFLALLFSQTSQAETGEKYWIFFKDKGPISLKKAALSQAVQSLSPRSLSRRAKCLSPVVEYSDIAIHSPYVKELQSVGISPIVKSKWLNAVSAVLCADQISEIKKSDFIRKIQPTLKAKRKPLPDQPEPLFKSPSGDHWFYNYGSSLAQNELSNIPDVHEMGVSGQGVLIAVFDTGFRLNHAALNHINVLATYDVIHNDPDVDYDPDQDVQSQISHGTAVLPIIAGFYQGELIGTAFSADFILAKTEHRVYETPAEEDYWIAAAEWADSIGADVISSSLGYLDWYNYRDMDGETAPITIAADLAVKKGIVVVTAAGNEADDEWKYIIAPADGDSVIAVGAVNSQGQIAGFSSLGPSYDGRIKPEVVAMGSSTHTISTPPDEGTGTGFRSISGTSASTPIVAGVAALVLSAFPDLTPMQVREAIIHTADRFNNPNDTYGYGLVNALAAVKYWGKPEPLPVEHQLVSNYPNPFIKDEHQFLRIQYDLSEPTEVAFEVYNVLGQKVASIPQGFRPAGSNQKAIWGGLDDYGDTVSSGLYFIKANLGGNDFISPVTFVK